MADKIDYKEYLAGLGKVDTSNKERIKNYLEEQCKEDEALKSLYRPEKLDNCISFIYECVQKMPRNGTCVCIEDAVVFKMARDYFLEILPKIAEEPPEMSKAVKKEADKKGAETEENAKAGTENEKPKAMPEAVQGGETVEVTVNTDKYGFEVFDDEPEEKAEPEPANALEEEKTDNGEVKYDENGNGLLFDFD